MPDTTTATRVELIAELDDLYRRYGWTNEATDTWYQYARGWSDTERIREEVEQFRPVVEHYEAAEASAR